ncbi:MAG: hypothetical protein EJNHJLOP_00010 [Methanophagales virus PBV082]|uniref:Uncharacterized protein n=1 Tax=Methanophagales virus PBV082 TaxID=3071307 RepID=A0AA46TDP3_9VIRU|nr:MAG: hypothetical protein QIT52_gp10 [Methanophagales virus PBV082]UYL64899.1 MAG: hypothetical protein EJNHJLOP_00010 [Methanophagales virus PBV082]
MGRVKCPVLHKEKHHIYGAVKGVKDIRAINCHIREQIRKAKSRDKITELVRRSLYLYTLTHAPAWKKAFEGKIKRMRQVAKEEYAKTARVANKRLGELGIGGRRYDEKIG